MIKLPECELTQNLNEEHVRYLEEIAEVHSYERGDDIVESGDPADGFFLITDGQISVEMKVDYNEFITVEHLSAYDVIGWSWCTDSPKWQYTISADNHVSVLRFDREALMKRFEEDYEFAYRLMKQMLIVMTRRLNVTRRYLMEFY